MGSRMSLLMLFLVLCHGVALTMGLWRTEVEEREEGHPRPDKLFMMLKSKRVAQTDAGEMRVLESYGGRILERRLNIGFINMEPRSLFIPQYIDSTLIIFLRSGIIIQCICMHALLGIWEMRINYLDIVFRGSKVGIHI